jgi:hypothetical protein
MYQTGPILTSGKPICNIPPAIRNGDSLSWSDPAFRDNLGNLLTSASWTLIYSIRGPKTLDVTAVADGEGFKSTISIANSASLDAGQYYWQAYLVDVLPTPTKRMTISDGQLQVLVDMKGASAGFDGRSQTELDLDAVQTAMRAIISGGAVQQYSIGNRHLQKMTMPDLIQLESRLKYRLARENKARSIANGQGNPHNMYVRFK